MAKNMGATLRGHIGRVQRRWLRERSMRRDRRTTPSTAEGLQFVVVLSYGRTGSTVLQAALNSARHVVVRGENHHVSLGLFRAWRAAVRTRTEHGRASATDAATPWFGAHLVDPDQMLEAMRDMFIASVLAPAQSTTMVGFKEIRVTSEYFADLDELVEYVVFLDRLLPGVWFIVNSRDVAPTLASGWWPSSQNAESTLETSMQWMEQLPALIEARLGAGRAHAMRYEQWSQDSALLVEMLGFLGITADVEAIERIASTPLQHMRVKS
jgi:hypothetical protein